MTQPGRLVLDLAHVLRVPLPAQLEATDRVLYHGTSAIENWKKQYAFKSEFIGETTKHGQAHGPGTYLTPSWAVSAYYAFRHCVTGAKSFSTVELGGETWHFITVLECAVPAEVANAHLKPVTAFAELQDGWSLLELEVVIPKQFTDKIKITGILIYQGSKILARRRTKSTTRASNRRRRCRREQMNVVAAVLPFRTPCLFKFIALIC